MWLKKFIIKTKIKYLFKLSSKMLFKKLGFVNPVPMVQFLD